MIPNTISTHIFNVFCVALKYICLYEAIPDSYVPDKLKKMFTAIADQFRVMSTQPTFEYGIPAGARTKSLVNITSVVLPEEPQDCYVSGWD